MIVNENGTTTTTTEKSDLINKYSRFEKQIVVFVVVQVFWTK